MKKYLIISALGLASFAFGQNYPNNNYPNNDGYDNNGWGDNEDVYNDVVDPYAYGTYDYSNANFPDNYYYDYPTDYYPAGYYQGYYNDYRNSVVGINWNSFFVEFRLSPFQIRQIMLLNNRFPSYNIWFGYYGMNPDRWYYDRFYALQQILGPRVFVVFQNRYYRGYAPWDYFRNYRTVYYVPRYHVMPRYRSVNINVYRVDRGRFFENHGNHYGWNQPKNSHFNGGSGYNNPRVGGWNGNNQNNGNHNWGSTPRNNNNHNSGGFPRNNQGNNNSPNWNHGGNNGSNPSTGSPRNNAPQGGGNAAPRENGGFRDNNGGGGVKQEGGSRGNSGNAGNGGGFRRG